MEIYYQFDHTETENLRCGDVDTHVYSIIAVVDGIANDIDIVHCTMWPFLEPDDILDYIHDGLKNFFQDLWDESEPDSFFPASEIHIRYPNAIKYSAK